MRQDKKCFFVRSFRRVGLFLFLLISCLCSARGVSSSDIEAGKAPSVCREKRSRGPRVHALVFFLVAAFEQALQKSQSQKTSFVVTAYSTLYDASQSVIPMAPGDAVASQQSAVSRFASIIRSFFGSAIAVGRFLHTVFLKK